MRLGARLRELRELQRKSLKEIASQANLSIAQLSKLELGERGLDVDVFVDIAKALGHQPGDLLPNSAGLYPEFRPLLARLSTVPAANRKSVLRAIDAMLDVHEDAVAAAVPDGNRQKIGGTAVSQYILPSPEREKRDELEDVPMPRTNSAALGVQPRRQLAERNSKPRTGTSGKGPGRRRGGAR